MLMVVLLFSRWSFYSTTAKPGRYVRSLEGDANYIKAQAASLCALTESAHELRLLKLSKFLSGRKRIPNVLQSKRTEASAVRT